MLIDKDKTLADIEYTLNIMKDCHVHKDIITGIEMAKKIVEMQEDTKDADSGIHQTQR